MIEMLVAEALWTLFVGYLIGIPMSIIFMIWLDRSIVTPAERDKGEGLQGLPLWVFVVMVLLWPPVVSFLYSIYVHGLWIDCHQECESIKHD